MPLTRQARRGVAISSTVALTAGFATVFMAAAAADEVGEPQLRVGMPSVTVDDAVAGKQVRMTVSNESRHTAENVAFQFTLDEPGDQMSLTALPNAKSDCEVTDERQAICPIGDLEGGQVFHLDALVLHVFDGSMGTGGSVQVTSDTEFNDTEAYRDFWVVGQDRPEGVDLATWSSDEVTVEPGETTILGEDDLAFYNQGSADADGISARLQIPYPIQVTALDGCEARPNDDFGVTFVDCEFADWTIPAKTEYSKKQGRDFAELTVGEDVESEYLGFIDGFAADLNTMPVQAASESASNFELRPRGGMPGGVEISPEDNIILMAIKAVVGDEEPTDPPTSDDPTSEDPTSETATESDEAAPRLPVTGTNVAVIVTAAAAFLAAGIAIMFLTRGRAQEESAEDLTQTLSIRRAKLEE